MIKRILVNQTSFPNVDYNLPYQVSTKPGEVHVGKLIELYLEVHGESGLLNQIESLNMEIKKLDSDSELDAGRHSRRTGSNPLPGIEGAS